MCDEKFNKSFYEDFEQNTKLKEYLKNIREAHEKTFKKVNIKFDFSFDLFDMLTLFSNAIDQNVDIENDNDPINRFFTNFEKEKFLDRAILQKRKILKHFSKKSHSKKSKIGPEMDIKNEVNHHKED
ncbi:unnamed protein product [Meloidogyne enterolobii]|uniref:Uncharacterized protein n=1 Tax=Meloidogyne enterolobii TaxID=390850 RepID=A0ACB1AZ58_MELEN